MRARYNKIDIDALKENKRFLDSKEALQKVLKERINDNTKLYIEIGMGKGDFIYNKAKNDKANIYIGIELCLPVLALAIKKINRYENEENTYLDNLYVMSFDALEICDYLGDFKVDTIYLNFSDPWPKKRHEKRRLTNEKFLEKYKQIMKDDAKIEFKTDNRGLFEYSLVSMQNFGFKFLEVYLDLHKADIDNVVTEYEEKFSKFGPIYKLVVIKGE